MIHEICIFGSTRASGTRASIHLRSLYARRAHPHSATITVAQSAGAKGADGLATDAAGNATSSSGAMTNLEATMLIDVLKSITPPLRPDTIRQLETVLQEHGISISVMRSFSTDDLKEQPFNIASPVERARIIGGVGQSSCAPPPNELIGGPVVVRPKVGFARLGELDTVSGTVSARFFVDHYWKDPRMVGQSSVPEGIWRPQCVCPSRAHEFECAPLALAC